MGAALFFFFVYVTISHAKLTSNCILITYFYANSGKLACIVYTMPIYRYGMQA